MAEPTTTADLLDLKMMPAWVNEPARSNDYADFEGEAVERSFERRGPRPSHDRKPRGRRPEGREQRGGKRPDRKRAPERKDDRREDQRPREPQRDLSHITVRFLPHAAAFESVVAQIKSGSITYSVFALARMFLDKPERYDVQLTASAESPLHQLGEKGAVAADARILEGSAFANAKDDFYNIEVTQTEPIKGNFTNVARDRVSGTLLGPTNHHSYQPQLRVLYEQRYSRRMSFQDFQRQIEVVSDPAAVEQWKEQARSITTFTTKNQEPPTTFSNAAEAERHFRETHLPTLMRSANELTISGVLSRRLPDRALGRLIENAWSQEIRSPSKMMQELAGGLRAAGLNIFRHRRGMLFVSPIRIRPFSHESAGVSASINSILQTLAETSALNRKQLAEKLHAGEGADVERAKLTLASDLHWLISEGYVIEFNDGSLDLPRSKPTAPAAVAEKKEEVAAPVSEPTAELPSGEPCDGKSDESGMTVEQSIEPMPEPAKD
ncbi:MAG: hypothetical protein ACXWG7_04010 [Chthoniobacterales bacterium]